MRPLKPLIDANREWSERIRREDPGYFERLARQQAPRYLWIGCSDSRVPANQIVGLPPGEVFVHRNVANVVVHTDLNSLSVIQFAIDVLRVEHIIVCGHYGCGGVSAVVRGQRIGLADNWLRHVEDVRERHDARIRLLAHDSDRIDRLCELNVIDQVRNVCHTTIVRDAWDRGQPVMVHGWVYGLKDGLVRDLGVSASSLDAAEDAYRAALAAAG